MDGSPRFAPAVPNDPTRVLIVDDSAVVRGLIARQVEAEADLTVAATASNGELALRELSRQAVDLVVLDIEMPVMDGLTALGRIAAEYPHVRVIMVSTLTRRNAEISLRALQLGAADYVAKPENGIAGAEAFRIDLLARLRALAPRPGARAKPAPPAPAPRPGRAVPEVLAIGASTGGPPALLTLFASLKGGPRQPILLTQHMPATFTALLAEQLSRAIDRPCAEGQDGEIVAPGRCYVAPGGWHMTVEQRNGARVIRLNQDPPENFCRPAVDPLLRGVAEAYGAGAMAAILTGMGSDGARGCEALARAGGRFVVQDEATSVVWGMPGAAAATGLAQGVLPLAEIGPWLRRSMETTR